MQHLTKLKVIGSSQSASQLIDSCPDQTEAVFDACEAHYGMRALKVADFFSRRWVGRKDIPYKQEFYDIENKLDRKGIFALNLSYEWACTTKSVPSASNSADGLYHYRAWDWPIQNIAKHVIISKKEGKAGSYWDMTYPGMIGCFNAVAPGRFSISINRAPLPQYYMGWYGNLVGASIDFQRTGHMPATFLLRKVFEEASNYDEARDMLSQTPICVPAIYTLTGLEEDESCVIERFRTKSIIHDHEAAAANNWINDKWKGTPRPFDSVERRAQLDQYLRPLSLKAQDADFKWLTPPVMNDKTRLVYETNAKLGTLHAVGIENMQAVTQQCSLLLPFDPQHANQQTRSQKFQVKHSIL